MHLGGIMLGAGMILNLAATDYHDGTAGIRFTLGRIVGVDTEWVVMEGTQQPTAVTPWQQRRIQVRISALKRSLA